MNTNGCFNVNLSSVVLMLTLRSALQPGTLEKAKTVTDKLMPESLPPGQSDSVKSYTPHIQYTKLEFKVMAFFFLVYFFRVVFAWIDSKKIE